MERWHNTEMEAQQTLLEALMLRKETWMAENDSKVPKSARNGSPREATHGHLGADDGRRLWTEVMSPSTQFYSYFKKS